MLAKKICIPLYRDEVHPRFDLALEAMFVSLDSEGKEAERKTVVFAHASADDLCDVILRENVSTLICGAVEEEYYHYLRWKRVDVLDCVAARAEEALRGYLAGVLRSGDILFSRDEASHA